MQKEQACGPSAEPGRARLTKVYKPHRAQVQPVRGLRASGSPGSGVVKSTAPVPRSSARAAQYQFWHRAVITTIRATTYGPASRRRQPHGYDCAVHRKCGRLLTSRDAGGASRRLIAGASLKPVGCFDRGARRIPWRIAPYPTSDSDGFMAVSGEDPTCTARACTRGLPPGGRRGFSHVHGRLGA